MRRLSQRGRSSFQKWRMRLEKPTCALERVVLRSLDVHLDCGWSKVAEQIESG
jgi:hypothetical protein